MGQTLNNNDPSIPVGDIAFFDNYLPSLEDGEYTISAKTEISGSINTQNYFDNPITQDFEVRGPQFALPATEVHSVYPPINSNSAYDQFLPNIVLNKRVLPWERYFNPADKTIPWLCLLVFAEGEIAIDPVTNSPLVSSTVTDFLALDDNVLKPDISLNSIPADVLSSMCSSIQISQETFTALAPKIAELKYLSHVRQVNTGDQAIMGFEDMGWFGVITGNRLLKTTNATGTRFFVHLVSLEGYFSIMNGTTPWPKKKSDPTKGKDIALASLYNWTFLSQPEKLNFKELVENFVTQSGGNANNLMLRRYVTTPANPDPAEQATLTRLQNGYVPMSYNMPGGDTGFAWYRGPLTSTIAQPLPRSSVNYHYPSASSMMIYDKTTGIFDQSYSAAWTIGRSLGLADSTFSQSLMQFRKKSYSLIGKLIDALTSAGDATQADLSEILKSSVVRDTFKQMVSKNIGSALTQLFQNPQTTTRESLKANSSTAVKESPVEVAKGFFAEPEIQAFLKKEIQNDLIPIAQWLANAQLLYNVPFNHLVSDQQALPAESLRFFYMDQNWLDSLVDGALSIGVQSSKDSFFNSIMAGVINDTIAAEIKVIRDKLMGTATGDTEADSAAEAMSGIIIRSSVVSGWPGLVVKAFKGDYATGTQLKLLRMDRLSPSVLICVFLDIPDTVMIAEPQQGLCFGIEDDDSINLRQLTNPPGKPTGKAFPATGGFTTFYRANTGTIGKYVLNINDGPASVVQTIQLSAYLNTTIGPAQFAMEMVKSPEEISFTKSSS